MRNKRPTITRIRILMQAAWGANARNWSSVPSQKAGITETRWDNSHDWRTMMDGYRLSHKDKQGRRGGGVMLCVKEKLECIAVSYGDCGSPTEFLRVKNKMVVSNGDHRLGTCHWPPSQENKAEKAIFVLFKASSRSTEPDSRGSLQLPIHLLEKQLSSSWITHQVPGMRREPLPHANIRCASQEWSTVGLLLAKWFTKQSCFVVSSSVIALAAVITILLDFGIWLSTLKLSTKTKGLDFRRAKFSLHRGQ